MLRKYNTTFYHTLIWSSLFLFLRSWCPHHSMELENTVIRKVIRKAPLRPANPNTQIPSTSQGLWCSFSPWNFVSAGISTTSVPEKNAVRMARSTVLLSPILSFHLATIFLSPSSSPPYCKMSGTKRLAWNLTDLHFLQGCNNRFQLDLPSLWNVEFHLFASEDKKGCSS